MQRGDIYWAHIDPPVGHRPVVVVTRTLGLSFLTNVTVAPITTTIRHIPSEVEVGVVEGLHNGSVASCDNLTTIPRTRLEEGRIGRLPAPKLRELDAAICFALGIPVAGRR